MNFILKNWRIFLTGIAVVILFSYIGVLKYENASQREKIGKISNDLSIANQNLINSKNTIDAMSDKIKADSQTIKNLQKIKENIQNAHNTKDDGAVAPVLFNTLNSLHTLQNNK